MFKKWIPLHKILFGYSVITGILSLFTTLYKELPLILIIKLITIGTILSWKAISSKLPYKSLNYINALLGVGFLAFFYNETAWLNQLFFKPIDEVLILADELIFGFQPAIEFSDRMSSIFFIELMNFGYLSYYFIIVSFLILLIKYNEKIYNKLLFLLSTSFIIYYVIFIFVPSYGPQFWYNNTLNIAPEGVFFQRIVHFIQENGEVKTGAIPSSHVGITLIITILSRQYLKFYFWIILPVTIILYFSTVYIKAHYFVDVIAGILSAPIILYIADKSYNTLKTS